MSKAPKNSHAAHAATHAEPQAELAEGVRLSEPEPLVAPPQPMGVGVLKVQKQRYLDWITAGGTPPIYT
jgi:hypothetical protein